ncbi:MAG: PAS domain S-box protein [Rhodopirellula sp.]|nr:PAS domain S-box protein [Rhodopirellula sp.]
MKDRDKTKQQLVEELVELRGRVAAMENVEAELRRSEAVLQAAVECLPFDFFVIGEDGRYLMENAVCRAHWGRMVGKVPEEMAPTEDVRALWLENNRRAFAGERVDDVVSVTINGEQRFISNILTPIRDETHCYGILGVNVDVTERKQAEEALRKAHDEAERRVEERTAELSREIEERKQAQEALLESERRVRNICDSALDAVIMIDAEGKVLYWNPASERMFGYASHEMMGCEAHAILTPACYRTQAIKAFSDFKMTGQGRTVGQVLQLTALRRDGTEFPIEISVAAFKMSNQWCAAAIIRDITERHKAQEALERERQSLWRMLQASDHERQVISYEIHDGLAQYLAAANLQFQVFDHLRGGDPEEAKKAYDAARQFVSQSHSEARRLISEVRPPVIDEIGLETAISHLVHEQRRHGGPEIGCRSNVRFGRLPVILENAVYRITQEALTNACKHSKSKKVAVTMTQEGRELCLEVRDWGIGFDPESVEKGHFGLEGIRQRVRLLGGRLSIESAPASGTVVQVVVPILEQQNKDC